MFADVEKIKDNITYNLRSSNNFKANRILH